MRVAAIARTAGVDFDSMTFQLSGAQGRRVMRLACVASAALAVAASPRALAQVVTPSVRFVQDVDANWRFSLGDFAGAAMPAFDDASWSRVDVPHDWSASGPFSADLGSGNGYAPGGVAWYRKHVTLPATLEGRIGVVEFDGVYAYAEVWVNGHLAGGRPYGYSSFEVPLTPFVRFGGADNVIAVRVDHSRFADSRWYTGSGIYRHVRLRFTDPLYIAQWGTAVTTPAVSTASATVKVETTVDNSSVAARSFTLESEVVLHGDVVARISTPGTAGARGSQTLAQQIEVSRPERWSIDSPALYVLRQRVRVDDSVADDRETTFGIRTMRFDPDRGAFLNDEPIVLKGVCVHHDAGSLGAAVPEAVWERRLRALKSLGVNAIRTSHNPPAPEFLDLADRLGLLVKDEAFDEFTPAKNKWVNGWNAGVPSRFGYAEVFDDWSVRDVEDMVRRDRNHPSVVMWSIGNEIDYPNDPFSHPVLGRSYRSTNPPAENLVSLARPLIAAVKALDATRPVTMGLASAAMADAVGLGGILDVVGYNYQESRYADDHATFPERVLFGSETSHSYDNWAIVRDTPYVAGQFLWTGIDYLGEARTFPNRASGSGLLDLAGFRKPAAWFRQSLWSATPMVYLTVAPAAAAGGSRRVSSPQEHWNWPEGAAVTVMAYSNADEVTLSLNGQSLGVKRAADATNGVLSWTVPFASGSLVATATTPGKSVAEFALRTAGAPARIELVEDRSAVFADSRLTKQIEFRLVDRSGVLVPNADADVGFEVDGPARILGIGNGNLNSIESTTDGTHRTYQGRGLLILRRADPVAAVTVRASSPGVAGASLVVRDGGM